MDKFPGTPDDVAGGMGVERGMTVGELVKLLLAQDQGAAVELAIANSDDTAYCNTEISVEPSSDGVQIRGFVFGDDLGSFAP